MTIIKRITALALVALFTGSAHATLMLDLGNSGLYAGTNSPAHAAGATTSTNWQLLTEDGGTNTATGFSAFSTTVNVDLGRAADDGDSRVSWKSNRSTNPVNASGSGIFGTSLTQDAQLSIVHATANRGPIGAFVNGLPNGQYDVYVVPHYAGNLNSNILVGIGVGNNTPNTSNDELFGLGFTQDQAIFDASDTSNWIEDENYAFATITIDGSNPFLYIMAGEPENPSNASDGFTATNVTLSSIQILEHQTTPPPPTGNGAIPEPATLGLVLISAAGLVMRRRVA